MKPSDDDMKPEYDFSGGVRGKYIDRLAQGSNLVALDQDVAAMFPDSASVNEALRALAGIIQAQRSRRSGRAIPHEPASQASL
ncbi:MAG: hypothetical protein EPN21_04090 [Methylococcaceae bacterium]|nr:MAG: hypothetical protein EPN21_04090 [Methylococcaceae bacterium]